MQTIVRLVSDVQKVLPMAQVAIFKEIHSIKCEQDDCELFYFELKRHNVSHYIYYLATDNIHIVLENDNTVLIKGLKKVVNVSLKKHASYRNVPR